MALRLALLALCLPAAWAVRGGQEASLDLVEPVREFQSFHYQTKEESANLVADAMRASKFKSADAAYEAKCGKGEESGQSSPEFMEEYKRKLVWFFDSKPGFTFDPTGFLETCFSLLVRGDAEGTTECGQYCWLMSEVALAKTWGKGNR